MREVDSRYVALLRAINVGGHRQIKMAALTTIFQNAGLTGVKTLIASGNVVFSSPETDHARLTTTIERAIAAAVGFDVDVMLRTHARMQELMRLNPFPSPLPADTVAYVTFLKTAPFAGTVQPFHNAEERFSIELVDGPDLFVMANLLPSGVRGDFGTYLTKTLSKIHTTRNWNTVVKLAAMESSV